MAKIESWLGCVCVWCRHISLFEELELLKEFEKRETTYTKRYSDKKQEKKSMETKVCVLNLYGHVRTYVVMAWLCVCT